jgi:CDP-alcohol phosphatidyltransferase
LLRSKSGLKMEHGDVLLYIPNLMGYARILIALVCVCVVQKPLLFACLYATASVLDMLDGKVARALNQYVCMLSDDRIYKICSATAEIVSTLAICLHEKQECTLSL